MNLIFHNEEKLYKKDNESISEKLESISGLKLHSYQKQMIDAMSQSNKAQYSVYGDDFKVEVNPSNLSGNCVLIINDYDANQKYEKDIAIDFTKDELDQFINLLQVVRKNMR